MGLVLDWSESSDTTVLTSPSYEWAMKTHPLHHHHHHQAREEILNERKQQPRCEWDLSLSAVVSSSSSSVDVIGSIEFDPTDKLLATAGISRKIRFYRAESLTGDDVAPLDHHANACLHCICTPAKLSSLRWRPDSGGRIIGSGDYDGVVTEYDLNRLSPVSERDEHGGRRVWSVDYTPLPGASSSVVGASCSDDGTVQVWDPRCRPDESIAVLRPCRSSAAVCCVEFDPSGGGAVAVGCADRRGYVYDVRRLADPAWTLQGHAKTVSYVRFLDGRTVVTAGTDGCLKLWRVDGGDGEGRVVRTYEGHVNSRNFVGLSVWRNGGLFGCGSENNRVFVYDKRWGRPVWVHGFEPTAGLDRRFVSSVCWRQSGVDQCTLVAGGSDGALQVYVGKRKP